MRWDKDGWLHAVFRLMIEFQPLIVRMEIRKDGSSWAVKPYADATVRRVDANEKRWSEFHESLFTELVTWIESVGEGRNRIGFTMPDASGDRDPFPPKSQNV